MSDNRTNVWLIVLAVIALGIGVVALIIGLNAKSTSDDAATQASLTKLQRRLAAQGFASKSKQKQQSRKQAQQGKQIAAQSKHEQTQTAEINSNTQKIAVLRAQIRHLDSDVTDLKARVNQLARTKKNK